MKPLTPLDLLVKRNMLLYPRMCPTRISVLCHLYLVLGNGYEWTSDGVLSDRDPEEAALPMPTSMAYDDLKPSDLEIRMAAMDLPESLHSEIVTRAETDRQYERTLREVRERHIDHLASKSDMFADVGRGPYENPKQIIDLINSGYGLARMPATVEASFRAGAIEVIQAVISSYNGHDMEREIALLRELISQIENGRVTGLSHLPDDKPDWEYRQAIRIIEEAGHTLSESNGMLVSSVREVKPAEHYTVVKALRMHGLKGKEFSNRFHGGNTTVVITHQGGNLSFTIEKAGQ